MQCVFGHPGPLRSGGGGYGGAPLASVLFKEFGLPFVLAYILSYMLVTMGLWTERGKKGTIFSVVSTKQKAAPLDLSKVGQRSSGFSLGRSYRTLRR